MITYGYIREVPLSVDQVLKKLPAILGAAGFTIVSRIELSDLITEKLGIEMPRYVIIGVVNPPSTRRALMAEENAGLFFPSNLITYQHNDHCVVGAVLTTALMNAARNDDLREPSSFIESKLKEVIDSILLEFKG